MLYRHKFHGLFIAGILRETERDEGRRDHEEILRGEGEKCKVSLPEVLCIIAKRKKRSYFPQVCSFCVSFPFPPFLYGWRIYSNLAVT